MRLIVAIVKDYDAPGLVRELTDRGWGTTQIASTGGALRAGATTLLIGVPRQQVRQVLRVIDERCRSAVEAAAPDPAEDVDSWYPPGLVAVEMGGATVSVLRVVRFERL